MSLRTAGPGHDAAAPPASTGAPADDRWRRWDVVGLLLLAAVLRLIELDEDLWLDEVAATVESFRRPLLTILTEPSAVAPHPLYELLARLSTLAFGEHPWSLRLPAMVAGTVSVPLLYLLVRRAAGRVEALLAGLIMALSFHHIFFSQDARGYTLMVLGLLVAVHALLRDRERPSTATLAAYVVAAALTAYAVPFGATVVAGHGIVALVVVVWSRSRGRDVGVVRSLAPYALATLLVVLLYAPLVGHAVGIASRFSGQVSLLGSLGEVVRNLQAGLGGTPGVVAAVAVAGLGIVDYVRRQPLLLALLGVPVVISLGVLVALQVVIHARFVFLALPLGIVVVARGLWLVWTALAARLAPATRRPAGAALVVAVALAMVVPLVPYYRTPRQDFAGALRVVDELVPPGDVAVGATLAGHSIEDFYRPGFPVVEDVDELRALEAGPGDVWVVTTLERVMRRADPALIGRLREDYELVRVLPATIDDGEMRIYRGPAASAGEAG